MTIDLHHHQTSFAAFGDVSAPQIPIHNNNNLQYFSSIRIGEGRPAREFNVIFDTGSDILWVPSRECTSSVCMQHHRLDSPSFVRDGTHSTLSYGTGLVKATNGHDLVTIPSNREDAHDLLQSSFTAVNKSSPVTTTSLRGYPISAATSMTQKPFASLKTIDGIFGISQKSNFSKLFPNFSIYLNNDTSKDGFLRLGDGYDGTHAASDQVTWHSTTDQNSWKLELVDIKVGNERMHVCSPSDPCTGLIDTGSSMITGPLQDVEKISSFIKPTCGGQVQDGPNLTLILRNPTDGSEIEYPLKPSEYSIDFQDTKECQTGIGPLNLGHKKWVIGDTFLRRYMAIFDAKNHKIGFIKSRHHDESIGVVTRGGQICPSVLLAIRCRQEIAKKIGENFLF